MRASRNIAGLRLWMELTDSQTYYSSLQLTTAQTTHARRSGDKPMVTTPKTSKVDEFGPALSMFAGNSTLLSSIDEFFTGTVVWMSISHNSGTWVVINWVDLWVVIIHLASAEPLGSALVLVARQTGDSELRHLTSPEIPYANRQIQRIIYGSTSRLQRIVLHCPMPEKIELSPRELNTTTIPPHSTRHANNDNKAVDSSTKPQLWARVCNLDKLFLCIYTS